jgi:hypothetical protein
MNPPGSICLFPIRQEAMEKKEHPFDSESETASICKAVIMIVAGSSLLTASERPSFVSMRQFNIIQDMLR